MEGWKCWGELELQEYLLGRLPERIACTVSEHLERCAACESMAQQLDQHTDAVVRSLRRAAGPAIAAAGRDDRVQEGVLATVAIEIGQRIAGYKLLHEVGRGGMAVVYQARQRHPDRLVALKVLVAGAHSDAERRARFRAEADAIARLRHPRIVQVYEAGEYQGLSFLALEYCEGGSLGRQLGGIPQTPQRAAWLVEEVAHAVQHAHQAGVVHRDLKPGNILLTADGEPKVSDFGLAKAERPELTVTGAVLGTPSYMAPEQTTGSRTIGPAADVYALGAILYEALTGRPPFQGASVLETMEQVRTQEPVPPRRLQPRVPRDLDTICLKCLEKEPGKRYADAGGLADDLERFRTGRPVTARPLSNAARAWRWARRNPGWAAMGSSVAFLLLVIVIGTVAGNLRLRDALAESDQRLERALQAERATEEELIATMVARARGISLSRRAGQRFASLAVLAEARKRARRLELPPERFLEVRNAAILALAMPDLHVGRSRASYPADAAGVDFDGDLTIYARTNLKGACEVRRVDGDQLLCRLTWTSPPPTSVRACWPLISDDGRFLAVRRSDDWAQVWRLHGPEPEQVLEKGDIKSIDLHAGSEQAVMVDGDGAITVLSLGAAALPGGQSSRRLPPGIHGPSLLVAIHPGGQLAAVASGPEGIVQFRNLVADGEPRTFRFPTGISRVVWHPRGHVLAASNNTGPDIYLFDWPALELVKTLHGPGPAARLAFNPSGDRLVAYSYHGELQLFDLPSGQLLFQTPTHIPDPGPRFARDGRRLACETSAEQLGIWEVADGREYRTLIQGGAQTGISYNYVEATPDNRLLAVQRSDGVYFWDLESGENLGRLPPQEFELPHFMPASAGAADGAVATLVTGGVPGLCRWPVIREPDMPGRGEADAIVYRIGPRQAIAPHRALCTGHSADGAIFVACAGMTVSHQPFAGGWIFHRDRLDEPLRLDKGCNVTNIAVSPDGRWVATSVRPAGPIKIWNARDGRLIMELKAWGGLFPRFSPDSKSLSVWGEPGPGGVYSTETWEPLFRFAGRGLISPDGRLLATESGRGLIDLLDARTGRALARLEDPHQETSYYHGFSPDGTRLLTVTNGRAGGIHVWDLRAIRAGLRELDLDWDAPAYPPVQATAKRPLRLRISAR
jgi:WD40 repeat protein